MIRPFLDIPMYFSPEDLGFTAKTTEDSLKQIYAPRLAQSAYQQALAEQQVKQAQSRYADQMAQAELEYKRAQTSPTFGTEIGALMEAYRQMGGNFGNQDINNPASVIPQSPGITSPPNAGQPTQNPPSSSNLNRALPELSHDQVVKLKANLKGAGVNIYPENVPQNQAPAQNSPQQGYGEPAQAPQENATLGSLIQKEQTSLQQGYNPPGVVNQIIKAQASPFMSLSDKTKLSGALNQTPKQMIENMLAFKSPLSASQSMDIELATKASELFQDTNIKANQKEIERQFDTANQAINLQKTMDAYHKARMQTDIKGPLWGHVDPYGALAGAAYESGFISDKNITNAQLMKTLGDNMGLFLGQMQSEGRITEKQGEFFQTLKFNPKMTDSAENAMYNYMTAMDTQVQQSALFWAEAVRQGIPNSDIQDKWQRYINSYPTFDFDSRNINYPHLYGWYDALNIPYPNDVIATLAQKTNAQRGGK